MTKFSTNNTTKNKNASLNPQKSISQPIKGADNVQSMLPDKSEKAITVAL